MNELVDAPSLAPPPPPSIGKETKVTVSLATIVIIAVGSVGGYKFAGTKADVTYVDSEIRRKDVEYQERFAAGEAQNNKVYAETYVRARIMEILQMRCRTAQPRAFAVSLGEWLAQYKALTGDDFNMEVNKQC